jgi:hypothetical protein
MPADAMHGIGTNTVLVKLGRDDESVLWLDVLAMRLDYSLLGT